MVPDDPYKFTIANVVNTETSTLECTLSLSGLDTSKWADGDASVSMILGFGGTEFTNLDAVFCKLYYSKTAASSFTCEDSHVDSRGFSAVSQSKETNDVGEKFSTLTSDGAKGAYSVKFTRPLLGTDPSPKDSKYILTEPYGFYWNYLVMTDS
jgi:hypothetical protein